MAIQTVANHSSFSVINMTKIPKFVEDHLSTVKQAMNELEESLFKPNAISNVILRLEKDEWWQQESWNGLRDIIISYLSFVLKGEKSGICLEVDWSAIAPMDEIAGTEISLPIIELDEKTLDFVERFSLQEGVSWLLVTVPEYFNGADFEIELIDAEEDEEILAVRVYGTLSASEFSERRHLLCKAMKEAGHRRLYEIISIFQRRTHGDGWETISWYSSLSEE